MLISQDNSQPILFKPCIPQPRTNLNKVYNTTPNLKVIPQLQISNLNYFNVLVSTKLGFDKIEINSCSVIYCNNYIFEIYEYKLLPYKYIPDEHTHHSLLLVVLDQSLLILLRKPLHSTGTNEASLS